MPDPVAHWVEKLSAKPLPALREGIQQVRVMLDSPSVDHVRLSNFIEFDPGFCVHVFRAMNRLPKRPKEIITKLSVALPMLGMERMATATRQLKAAETVLKRQPFAGLTECFSRAAHAAIYALILAQRQEAEAPSEYAVAALLHDIAEMALWVHSPEQIEDINLRAARGEPRVKAAREVLGCTIEQISEGISRAWELPALTIQAQDPTNSYIEAPLTVMLAAALARSTAEGWHTRAARDAIELLAEFLDMEYDAANGYLHALAAEAARRLTGRGFRLPAFSLIQQQPAAPRQAPATAPKQAAAAGRPTLADTISGALHAMRDQQHLRRLMFATITPDRKGLKCRFAVDIPTRPSLKGFSLKFERTNLFTALLKKAQTFWLNDDNRSKYLPLVPPQTRSVLSEDGFIMMSVFMKNRPVGILYADSGDSGAPLTADSYAVFKTHCQRLVQTLNQSF